MCALHRGWVEVGEKMTLEGLWKAGRTRTLCLTLTHTYLIKSNSLHRGHTAARLALRERLLERVAERERVGDAVRLRERVLVGEGRGAT